MAKTISDFLYLNIDKERNLLLCSNDLVGIGELVEIHAPDEETPRQACGKTLRKTKDPNEYVIQTGSFEHHVDSISTYMIGNRSVLRVVARNRSGALRRNSSSEEKQIVNLEKNERYKEKRVVRAKTGSVRKRKRK